MNKLYEAVDNTETFVLDEETNRHLIDVKDPANKPDESSRNWYEYDKTNPWGFQSNNPKKCPVCDSSLGLIYGYNQTDESMHAAGKFEYDDDGWFSIPWKCKKCGAEGIVIFSVEYWSQGVFTKDGMVEVRNCGIDPQW